MIVINLDVVMAQRKMASKDLAEGLGITQANLSILKNQKAKAIRLETLDSLCRILNCQPGDILEYREE
ncbi:MAG: helix-turn-helix transcriptional regulator [Saccharofermentans sp.]|nr:helix-turn-helix transcriptional regulator [Saccharofermentans sp.]